MKKQIVFVGLFGISLSSVNYGVTALGISQICMLEEVSKAINKEFYYEVFSDDDQNLVNQLADIIPIDRIKIRYIIRLKTGLKGLKKIRHDISNCDVIIDLTYGDGFSDIYGIKGFLLYSLPKYITVRCNKLLILGPQTIGPYNNKLTVIIAKYILSRVDYIFARDDKSKKYCDYLASKNVAKVTSDLAVSLPYFKEKYSFEENNKINIGLNVSLLLWEKSNEFDFKLDYKNFTKKLIEVLIEENINLHVIAHVYDPIDENEYWLAMQINQKYKETILAPQFANPIDAKNYISNLDFFIGARMHATIAAFSARVPVAPISYSIKFEGLYDSIEYPYTINCKLLDDDAAINKIVDMINNIRFYKEMTIKALERAREKNNDYKEALENIIGSI